MRLTDRFDGSAAPFEGDRTLEIRSLPANARVSKATVTLTPAVARGGALFEETIVLGGEARVSRGATKFGGTGFVEVDFHQRRTLRSVQGNNVPGANLQVEMGGIYLQLNGAGAIKTPSDTQEFTVPNDRKLPGLTVSKFKLTRDSSMQPGPVDLTSVTVASVPLNVTARIGNLPPFFARVGEMSQEQVSPDFTASLQAFLAEAPVENGFCVVPLVLHSDLIARISVALAIDYVVESAALPAGVGEPLLPFDYSGQAATGDKLLTIEVPANRCIARRGIQGRVTGKFDDTRILHPSPLPLVPVKESGRVVSIASDSTLAQPIKLDVLRVVTSIDLLLAVRHRGALQLDLREDADGKPGSVSLLPGPARFEPAAQEDLTASWLSVPLPAEFQFKKGTRYWLVLQTLDGEADWRVEPKPNPKPLPPKPEPGMQRTQDDALSWRDAVPPEAGLPFAGLFRLRGRTTPYRMPIEMRVGTVGPGGRQPRPVSLDRFAVSGRVDFTLDFEELSDAANAYLDSATSSLPATGEHLVNGEFRDWLAIGDRANQRVDVDLDIFVPAALALAPNGSRAYLAGGGLGGQHTGATFGGGGLLKIVDLACSHLLEEETVILGDVFPRALVLSPDGSRAYVGGRDQLLLVDLTTGTPSSDSLSIPGIFALASSPDGGILHVTTFSGGQAGLQAIDTAALENFLFAGQGDEEKITLATSRLDFGTGAFIAVSPNGEQLYLTSAGGQFQVLDVDRFSAAGNTILLGGGATGIAITPDGSRALVPMASPARAIAIVDLAGRTVTHVPLGATAFSLAVASNGASAYVAMADRTVSILDLERSTLRAETIQLGPGTAAGMLALSREGDRLAVTNERHAPTATGTNSLSVIEFGVAWPNEWNVVAGQVSRYCFPGLPHPIAFLGSAERTEQDFDNKQASAPAGISQVVAVVAAARYEISFRAIATNADAFAEVIWRGQNGEAFPAERVPIQALRNGNSDFAEALRNTQPLLASHRKQLIAPAGARQAEIRFIVAEGVVAAIAEASFTDASERVVNGDFSLRGENGLSAWTLPPTTGTGVTLLASADGIRVQNAGNLPVELVQNVSAEALQFFTLEFEGRVLRPSTEANPRIELQWLRNGSPVDEPIGLEISADGLTLSSAHGRSPDATAAEIRLAVPNGAALEAKRISLRFTKAIPVTLNFIAESPGEIAVTDLRAAFQTKSPKPPPPPDDGLYEASPMPDAPCQERLDDEASFCPCCQRVQPLVDASRMETEAGRPVLVGRCRGCGAEVPRFGGKSERGAASFALRRGPVASPVILAAHAPRPSLNQPEAEERISPAEALMNIDRIGPQRAERLMAQGIDTPAKLAETSAEEIVKMLKPGVSRQQAEKMRTEARSPAS